MQDLRKVFDEARDRRRFGQGTILFVDEIHRFNRSQQDSFLPYVEDGTIILVGATTENPSFELNGALLSRTKVLVFKRLGEADLELLLERAKALQAAACRLRRRRGLRCWAWRMATAARCLTSRRMSMMARAMASRRWTRRSL